MLRRWALLGVLLGGLLAALAFAPAAWLARALASASEERLLLADARGTVWRGSAVMVLTGGAGSRDASALPGRITWRLGLDGAALALRARHDCCINGELLLRLKPGIGRMLLELPAGGGQGGPGAAARVGSWPASWLVGLGTPWNTLQPTGTLLLSTPGLAIEQVQGRWRFSGQAVLELVNIASRLSTLDTLGSYRLTLDGGGGAGVAGAVGIVGTGGTGGTVGTVGAAGAADAADAGPTRLQLSTTAGALQLSGRGEWAAARLRFSGQASAAEGAEGALGNLLNIIGRRQGAVSIISIG